MKYANKRKIQLNYRRIRKKQSENEKHTLEALIVVILFFLYVFADLNNLIDTGNEIFGVNETEPIDGDRPDIFDFLE